MRNSGKLLRVLARHASRSAAAEASNPLATRSCASSAPAPGLMARSLALAAQRVSTLQAPTFATRAFSSSSDDEGMYGAWDIAYPPPEVSVGQPAPQFKTMAVVDGDFKEVSLSDYKGKYVVLFFYPKDFTYVCPTEIIAFSDRAKEFEALGCQLLACSTDTEESHLAWIKTPRSKGGLGYMQIPILADTTKAISARYGVLIEKLGIALRGLFVIDPNGVVKQVTINDLPIGRSVDETLRLIQAIQFHAEHGEVCPANWKPGDKGMHADAEKSLEYFQAHGDSPAAEAEIGAKLTPLKSKSEYEALVKSGKPAVVDFYADWCGKCRQLSPFVDELVGKYPGITFAKINTNAEPLEALCGELGVKGLPAFHFYKGGKQVVPSLSGYKKQALAEAVEKLAKA